MKLIGELHDIRQLNEKDQLYIKQTILEKRKCDYDDLTDESKLVVLDGFKEAVNKCIMSDQARQKVYFKNYYEKNKDKHQEYIQTPIRCEACKCDYKRGKKSVHFRSHKHIKNAQ